MGPAASLGAISGRYVPRLVREWIADDPSPRSRHRSIEGTMVFADVSGFTKLSERLSRLGRVGPEEITAVIESTFSVLLDEAYAHDATLLQFGGDALLLFFRGDQHALRGAAAALDMRRALRERRHVETPAGRVTLSMTVGVQSGDFDLFLVGASHRQLVVGGPTASALVQLESAADKGRILLGDATAAALPRRNVGGLHPPGRLLRGTIDVARQTGVDFLDVDADLTGFVPVNLLRAIESGEVHSEHRTATVAFIQFLGLDQVIAAHGPDDAAERLDALMCGVQTAIDDRAICLQSADIGVDGGKLYLSVGAPISTGHDEEHMLLAMREVVELDVGLALKVGVNTGPVFTGQVGIGHRRVYTTMGDTVNLAARVMAKSAVGELWATPPVLERSRTLFATTPVPPFAAKGKRLPVHALAVGPVRGARAEVASADLPFVGRDEELAALLDAVASAASGRGRVVELTAEPGAGKSRLLRQLEEQVEVPVRSVGCRLYQSSTPYYPFHELLRRALGLLVDGDGSEAAMVERLRTLVQGAAPELEPWLALIGTAAGLTVDPSPELLRLDDEYRKPRLEQAVVALLRAVVTEPTVLGLEDANWIYDASRDLLVALAAAAPSAPWVLLVAHRGRADDEPLVAADARLHLAPLGPSALRQLVVLATEDDPLPGHVVSTLVDRCDGNPLFLMELLSAVRAGADLDSLPDSVEGLITARIDRLSTADRNVLRRVAVLGTVFEQRYARTVLPGGADQQVGVALRRLEEFLAVEASGRVAFRHVLVRDVAYQGLPYRLRRELHGAIGDDVVARLGERAVDEASMLSFHFAEGQRHEECWRFSNVAGDRARDVYANVDAARFYRRALGAARHLDAVTVEERVSVLESLGDVLDLAGDYDQARRAFTTARRLVAGDLVRSAELDLKSAYVDERMGRFVTAVRSIRRGQRLLDAGSPAGADVVRARLATWLAVVRLDQGRFPDALVAAREAMRRAEAADDRATLAQASITFAHAGSALGAPEAGDRARLALELATEIGDLRNEAVAANVLGGHAFFEGRWDEAADLYRRSRAVREEMGDPGGAAAANANLAELLVEQGRHADADELLGEVLAVWRAAGDLPGVAFALRLRGLARVRAGQVEAGRTLLEESRAAWDDMGASHDVLETDVALAEALVLAGRDDEAVAAVDGLLAADPASAGLDHLVPTLLRLRALALVASDPAAAAADVEASLAAAREQGADHLVALALLADEVVRRRAGQPPDAARRAERDELVGRLGVALAVSGT